MVGQAVTPNGFGEWWVKYPRKVGKYKAEAMWNRLTLPERQEALDTLPAHVHYWRWKCTEWEFIPHPVTWLGQHRFQDEIPQFGGSARLEVSVGKNGHESTMNQSSVPSTINGAPAASSGPMPADSPLLVAAGAPPVVRSSNGPVPLSTIFAGLKQQLKRSS